MATTSTRLTYADLVAMPEDGKRHELIDGEHYVTPAPTTRHQLVLAHLHLDLGGYVEANGLGQVFFAPLDVVLSDYDVVEPDLLFVSTERLARLGPAHQPPLPRVRPSARPAVPVDTTRASRHGVQSLRRDRTATSGPRPRSGSERAVRAARASSP
jgi:hypothetical protein